VLDDFGVNALHASIAKLNHILSFGWVLQMLFSFCCLENIAKELKASKVIILSEFGFFVF
jgi:hypothetical protein